MPTWTLAEIASKATARIGRRSDIALSEVSFWVNAAYQEVAQAAPSAMMETIAVSSTTSGENRLELPADCLQLMNLSWLTSGGGVASALTLRRTNLNRVDSTGFTPIGKPAEYALFNNWVELWPSPNSAYSLQMRYLAYPSDMTATTAVPSLATEWRPAVLYLAEAFLHELVGNEVEGASARVRYAGYVGSLKDKEARRASSGEMRISFPARKSRW
jgi:hypothetical protein